MSKILCASVSLWLIFLSACSELEKPKTEPFYAQTAPPAKKEFRWSNGRMPKSLDPALAGAPPETDVVRAVFEGLTDTNPKTLEATPSVAENGRLPKISKPGLLPCAKTRNGRTASA